MYPPALTLVRRPSENYPVGDTGITIPTNSMVIVPVYSLHRDPENFPDPEVFKPERFFPENRIHHPYSYLPFGSGPRNCLAMRLALMEVKLALIHAVYHYKFSVAPKTQVFN